MGRRHRGLTKPKSKAREQRFEAWLQQTSAATLDKTYAAAVKTCNAYQKSAIVAEWRRREIASEEMAS